jgi:hypothetical protein
VLIGALPLLVALVGWFWPKRAPALQPVRG